MQPRFAVLRSEIHRELENVRRLVAEAEKWQSSFADWPEIVRVRTTGGILHDFYTATERIFRLIATRIDQDLPEGVDWHIQLLRRMATTIDKVRPAVLEARTAQELDEYLRFRHLFRNVYGFDLEWERCRELLARLAPRFAHLDSDIQRFDEFLQTLEDMA